MGMSVRMCLSESRLIVSDGYNGSMFGGFWSLKFLELIFARYWTATNFRRSFDIWNRGLDHQLILNLLLYIGLLSLSLNFLYVRCKFLDLRDGCRKGLVLRRFVSLFG